MGGWGVGGWGAAAAAAGRAGLHAMPARHVQQGEEGVGAYSTRIAQAPPAANQVAQGGHSHACHMPAAIAVDSIPGARVTDVAWLPACQASRFRAEAACQHLAQAVHDRFCGQLRETRVLHKVHTAHTPLNGTPEGHTEHSKSKKCLQQARVLLTFLSPMDILRAQCGAQQQPSHHRQRCEKKPLHTAPHVA